MTERAAACPVFSYEDVVPPTANTRFVPGLGTTHVVTLTGLVPCTHYYYEVKSVDSLGNATTDNNSGLYYSFMTGRQTQYAYGGPPQAIPDFTPGASSFTGAYATITVPDDRPIDDVDVAIDAITHPAAGEVAIYLIAPDATEILLSSFRGGTSPGYMLTVFDDAASTPIGSGAPPFSGSFRPEVPLSSLNSLSTKGHWTLRVVDAVPGNTGTLHTWSLTFSHPAPLCGPGPLAVAGVTSPDACNGTGAAGGDGNVDPGEDVVMQVTARNDGTQAVTNVSATLSTGSSFVTVTNPNAAYPDIPAGGSASPAPATPGFAFHVDAAAPCGSMLGFQVLFSSSQGSWVQNVQVLVGPRVYLTTNHSAPGTPMPIPDPAPPPAASVINVADPDPVLDVNVHLNVTHTADENLDIFLIGPNGISVELSTDNGSYDDDFVNTTFDDDALIPITSGPVPFTGSFRPETPLSALNGSLATGSWTLEIADDTPFDFGKLVGWDLELTTLPPLACSVCTVVPPGEATNLRWAAGGKNTLNWDAAPNATSHNVYRGEKQNLPDLLTSAVDSCKVASSFTLTTGPILNEPAVAARLFWYLVRGSNTVGEGSAGAATSGQRIHNSSGVCP